MFVKIAACIFPNTEHKTKRSVRYLIEILHACLRCARALISSYKGYTFIFVPRKVPDTVRDFCYISRYSRYCTLENWKPVMEKKSVIFVYCIMVSERIAEVVSKNRNKLKTLATTIRISENNLGQKYYQRLRMKQRKQKSTNRAEYERVVTPSKERIA